VAPLLLDGEQPDRNDRYMMFQAILGAWPAELMRDRMSGAALSSFRERMEAYLVKALRESKRHTSWLRTNDAYEEASLGLLQTLLGGKSSFLKEFRPLAQQLTQAGALASLSRTILKCTVPGVPDIYQGTEFWDYSLVDPDNRRPVDYKARMVAISATAPLEKLLEEWPDGRIKQRVLSRLLADRAAAPDLYARGRYVPLAASGSFGDRIVAFERVWRGERLVVAVPRLTQALAADGSLPVGPAWAQTRLPVRGGAWREVLTGREIDGPPDGLDVASLFATVPFAVLRG
jgi:(1->4)-alpha-D-glucan 1-alpha-D-glucosylmutase